MTFDPNTIEHLGVRMYSTLPPVLTELIANAHDADAGHVFLTLKDIAEKEIAIEDDGLGMVIEFEVEVQNAAPFTTFDLLVDGVVVGQIATDDEGEGELEFSSESDEEDQMEFPAEFPEVAVGSVITLMNAATGDVILQGTFVLEQENDADGTD